MELKLKIMPETFAMFKIENTGRIAGTANKGAFYSFARSPGEVTVICEMQYAPVHMVNTPWRIFKYTGSVDDRATGVVASITKPLADAGISVIVNTTYDSGYFGVEKSNMSAARHELENAGFSIG